MLEEWESKNIEDLSLGAFSVRQYPIIPIFLYSSIPDLRLERETGLEPATTTLATWGSTN